MCQVLSTLYNVKNDNHILKYKTFCFDCELKYCAMILIFLASLIGLNFWQFFLGGGGRVTDRIKLESCLWIIFRFCERDCCLSFFTY